MNNTTENSDKVRSITGEDLSNSIRAREAEEARVRDEQSRTAAEEVVVDQPKAKAPWYKHWAVQSASEGVIIGLVAGAIVYVAVGMAAVSYHI